MIDITKRINTPAIYEDILYIKDLIQLATPQKVKYSDTSYKKDGYLYHRTIFQCPNCDTEFFSGNFCQEYGQRICWGE